jgi:hypothetical protein
MIFFVNKFLEILTSAKTNKRSFELVQGVWNVFLNNAVEFQKNGYLEKALDSYKSVIMLMDPLKDSLILDTEFMHRYSWVKVNIELLEYDIKAKK